MEIKDLGEGKIQVTEIIDFKNSFRKWSDDLISGSYDFRGKVTDLISQEFMKTHGKEIVDSLKEKMLTEWVDLFKSEVLKNALKKVMEPDKNY